MAYVGLLFLLEPSPFSLLTESSEASSLRPFTSAWLFNQKHSPLAPFICSEERSAISWNPREPNLIVFCIQSSSQTISAVVSHYWSSHHQCSERRVSPSQHTSTPGVAIHHRPTQRCQHVGPTLNFRFSGRAYHRAAFFIS